MKRRHTSLKSALPVCLILLVTLVANAWLQPGFFDADSLASNLLNATPILLICMAQAVIVFMGELDLSVGAGMSLINCVLATLPVSWGWSVEASCLAALSVALGAGVVNGLLVGVARQSALIATFATAAVWFGLALWLMPQPGGLVSSELIELSVMQLDHVWAAALPVLMALGLWFGLQRHRFGRRLLATGSDPVAAFQSGINVRVVKLLGYVYAWFFVFCATLSLSAQTASGDARLGLPYTLSSIAGVVLGGISLTGGRGSMLGALAGALTLALIGNVIYFAGIPSNYQELIKGVVLLAAISFTFIGTRSAEAS